MMAGYSGVSDLSSSWSLLRRSKSVRADADVVGKELSTGLKAEARLALEGQTANVVGIDRSLELLSTVSKSISLGSLRADATQSALESIRKGTENVMQGVLTLVNQGSAFNTNIQADEANAELEAVVSTLNGSVAGQSLFAGAATDGPALIDAPTLLSDVEAILAAAPDVPTALANIDFYFNDPAGGYLASRYLGANLPVPDVSLGENETVGFDIRADDAAIRETLRNLTLVAGLANGAFTGTPSEVVLLYEDAATTNLNTATSLLRLQESLGYDQERIEEADARNASERLRLQLFRTEVAAVDQYEAAARLQDLEGQIEKIYLVTARLGQLSLANYLR